MANLSSKLTVTAVMDKDNNCITAFFNELPGLVVQGKTTDDIKNKLQSLLASYIKRLDSLKNNFEIETQSL